MAERAETIVIGDCLEILKTLPDESIQCCVTSPPYWGLRDYGVPGQLGLEPTPDEYVQHLVQVFREVRRVLKESGTLWLNLGDSYTSGGRRSRDHDKRYDGRFVSTRAETPPGLKPKELVGIPWRVALALQADGWYLRSDIIWHKPNAMPESVSDRPTKAHEYLFLLTKSPKYFYDRDAIREPHSPVSLARVKRGRSSKHKWTDGPGHQTLAEDIAKACHPKGRNKRTVWTIPTKGFRGAHFATFPEDLVRPCILAGAPLNARVLDPFLGSGTTGVVCKKLHRQFIGIELNPNYASLALERLQKAPKA